MSVATKASERHPVRRRVLLWLLVVSALAAAGYHLWLRQVPHVKTTADDVGKDRIFAVRKGNFNITVNIDGNLDAIKRHMIMPEFAGKFGLEIAYVVEDRTKVKKGDLLVEFSAEKYHEEEEKLVLAVDDQHTNLRWALEDFEMTKAGNLSLIKIATDKLRDSREALDRYEELDAPRKRRELNVANETAEEKAQVAESALTTARNELSDAYMGDPAKVAERQKSVDDATVNLEKAVEELENARYQVRIFRQYDHPQKLRTLRETVTKNSIALQRELVDATGNVIKAERQIQNQEIRLRQLQTEMERLLETIAMLKLTAPVDGIVSLGNPMRRPWQQAKEIKIGTQVNTREIIVSIPDLSQFMVEINLPEEFRSRIEVGLPAQLRSKAIPDLVLGGTVSKIAPMAVNVIHWDRNSPKIYPTEISTEAADPRLMPGMTMRVEVIVETVEDALYVPIEAVYSREGKTYCRLRRVAGSDERLVKVGRTSNHYVEIVEGVEVGDEVLLHRQGLE